MTIDDQQAAVHESFTRAFTSAIMSRAGNRVVTEAAFADEGLYLTTGTRYRTDAIIESLEGRLY
jgi:hypothetical protein